MESIIIGMVTQEDIDNGVPTSSCSCPISRMLKRVTGIDDIVTGLFYVKINKIIYRPTEQELFRNFVDNFDFRGNVVPTQFTFIKET